MVVVIHGWIFTASDALTVRISSNSEPDANLARKGPCGEATRATGAVGGNDGAELPWKPLRASHIPPACDGQ
jgi:hypothetical protein